MSNFLLLRIQRQKSKNRSKPCTNAQLPVSFYRICRVYREQNLPLVKAARFAFKNICVQNWSASLTEETFEREHNPADNHRIKLSCHVDKIIRNPNFAPDYYAQVSQNVVLKKIRDLQHLTLAYQSKRVMNPPFQNDCFEGFFIQMYQGPLFQELIRGCSLN